MALQQLPHLTRYGEMIYDFHNPKVKTKIDPDNFYNTLQVVYQMYGMPYTDEENDLYNQVYAFWKEYQEELKFKKQSPEVSKTKESPDNALLELSKTSVSKFFKDQNGETYAVIENGGHKETINIDSVRFELFLGKSFCDKTGQLAAAESVKKVKQKIKADAEFGSEQIDLSLRVSKGENAFYYDLTNTDWQSVRITSNGWKIEESPILFRRFKNQQEQDYPSEDYPLDIFDKFMSLTNVKNQEHRLLLKCYIVSLFIPDISKAILAPYGEKGAAKSSLCRLIKKLVDPSSADLLSLPKNQEELVQHLSHNYLTYYDNLSNMPDWISDVLCKAVTGLGFSKRQLYTNEDDLIYNFKRCVGFNGINQVANRPDLLDRALLIELLAIPEDMKRRDSEIERELEELKPQLLGYIFDMLVKFLQVKEQGGIKLARLPRMADFAEACEIIARCMGYPDNAFIDAYYKNITIQTDEAIESNPVAQAIMELMKDRQDWKGTASQLLQELNRLTEGIGIDTKQNYAWPKLPNKLSAKLNEVKPNLRQVGIEVNSVKERNSRVIQIHRPNEGLRPFQ